MSTVILILVLVLILQVSRLHKRDARSKLNAATCIRSAVTLAKGEAVQVSS